MKFKIFTIIASLLLLSKTNLVAQNNFEWYQFNDTNYLLDINTGKSQLLNTEIVNFIDVYDSSIAIMHLKHVTYINKINGDTSYYEFPLNRLRSLNVGQQYFWHVWHNGNSHFINRRKSSNISLNNLYENIISDSDKPYLLAQNDIGFYFLDTTDFKINKSIVPANKINYFTLTINGKEQSCYSFYGKGIIHITDTHGNLLKTVNNNAQNEEAVNVALKKIYGGKVKQETDLSMLSVGRGNENP